MRGMKRFVSLLMAVAMLLTSAAFTLAAHAEDAAALPAVEVTDADWLRVEKLEAFGAITNEYEDIGMYVARRQMVDIIITYLRMQVTGTNSGKSPFLDVSKSDPTIDGIVALYNAGIITGDNEYKFYPDDYLTYDEAIVFVVNAVGHKLFAMREGGFPTGYHRIAIKNDMLEGLKFNSGKEFIPLCDVYKMLESAMDIGAVTPVVFTSGEVDYQVSDTETYLSDVYGITKHKGIVTGTENTRLTKPDSSMTDEQVEIDNVIYDTPGYVYATSLGRAVYYYLRKTSVGEYDIAYVEENDKVNRLKKVESDDLLPAKSTATRIYYTDENDKERHLNLTGVVDVIYNGKCYKGYGSIANVLPGEGYIEALDNTGDEVYDVLFVYEYENIIVGAIDTYEETIEPLFGAAAPVALGEYGDRVDIRLMPDGKKLTLDTIKQWDVATVMRSVSDPQMISVYISRNTVTGTVEEVSDEFGYLINGEYYEDAHDYVGTLPDVGTGATFYLNFNNQIVAMKRDGATSVGAYAVLTGIDYDTTSIDSTMELRLFTAEGQHITAPLKNVVNLDGEPYTVAADMDKVAEILSKGEVSGETGDYAVVTPHVVKYVINDGAISYIDVSRTNASEGDLKEIATGTSLLSRTNGFLKATTDEGDRVRTYFKKNDTLVFCTPALDDLGNQKGYSIQNTLLDNRIYNPNSAAAHDEPTQRYVLYNIASSGLEITEVILLIGRRGGSSGGSTGGLNIVTSLRNAVNSEGIATVKLCMNENSSAIVADVVTVDGVDVNASALSQAVLPGTVIKYETNFDGEVETITTVTTYDATTKQPIAGGGVDAGVDLTDRGNDYTIMAEVTNIDFDLNLIEINDNDFTQLIPAKGTVITYRPEREKATTGNVNSIAVGDYIVFSGEKYYEFDEIIVYKK